MFAPVPYTDESRIKSLDTAGGRQLALMAAEQSIVLLINNGQSVSGSHAVCDCLVRPESRLVWYR